MKYWKHLLRCVTLLLCAAGMQAQAAVWTYTDEAGSVHYASDQRNERYTLLAEKMTADKAAAVSAEGASVNSAGAAGQAASGAATAGTAADAGTPVSADGAAVQSPGMLSAAAQNVVRFFESVPGAQAVENHLREASELHGVDFYLLQALIATESGFNVRAMSHAGAVGLMQIMPTTAAKMGLSGDKKNPIRKKLQDPQTNINYGTKYFATIQNMFTGRLDLALAAYNAGEGAVQRAGNQIPNINETRNFVKKVTDIYTSLKARAMAQILPGNPVAEPAANTAVSLPAIQ